MVIQLATTLVLARLLFPEAFGLILLVRVFLLGAAQFVDTGVRLSVINHHREDRDFLRTAFSVQIGRGLVIAGAAVALAGPYAIFYGQPELAKLIMVGGLAILIENLASIGLMSADRKLSLGRRAGLEIVSLVVGTCCAVAVAWQTESVWAFLAGHVARALVWMLGTHILLPGPGLPKLEKKALLDLLHFGKWVFLSTVLAFLAMQSERLFAGKFFDLATVGVFGVAIGLVRLVVSVVTRQAVIVFQPLWAATMRRDQAEWAQLVVKHFTLLMSALSLAIVGLAAIGQPWFRYLYDDRYEAAGGFVPLLCLAFWFFGLQNFSSQAALALHDAKPTAKANGQALFAKSVACFGGFAWFGMQGFLAGIVLGNLAGLLSLQRHLANQGADLRAATLQATLRVILLGATAALLPIVVADFLGGGAWRPISEIIIGLVVLIPLLTQTKITAQNTPV